MNSYGLSDHIGEDYFPDTIVGPGTVFFKYINDPGVYIRAKGKRMN